VASIAKLIVGSFTLNLGKFSLPVTYIQAIAVLALIFFLVLILAQFRRHYVNWSFKGALFGIVIGFLLALALEGFLLVGGKTVLISVLGWKNPPAPISNALDAGRSKLLQVLGTETQVSPTLIQDEVTVTNAIELFQSLNPTDIKKVKSIICQP
jgi:hypothetical protein